MKQVVLGLALLALLLPIAARADGIDLTNRYGTITILDSGITSKGSQLLSFNQFHAPRGHAMGSVSFWTGGLSSGSIWTGGTFSDVGSGFVITGVGNFGQPKGMIFDGAFIGPINWAIVGTYGKFTVVYQLTGSLIGQLWTGRTVTGTTTQTITTYKNQEQLDHKGSIKLGQSHLSAPEPSTLGMLGTGLVAAGAVRRKLLGS